MVTRPVRFVSSSCMIEGGAFLRSFELHLKGFLKWCVYCWLKQFKVSELRQMKCSRYRIEKQTMIAGFVTVATWMISVKN